MGFIKRFTLAAIIIFTAPCFTMGQSVGPLIQNEWTTFTWPYNAYLPEAESGVNGHVGNACGYTSIARILHYWGYPVNGTRVIDFTDYFGVHWYCDLTSLDLNYTAMPRTLSWNASEDEYHETAMLFLAAAAVGEIIGIGYSDGHLKISDAMVEYFNFKTGAQVVNRWDYTKEEWIQIFKNELDNGRPIMLAGRTPDSPAPWESGSWSGHWWICDGYNENGEFYVDYAFNNIKGYYDIDSLGGIYISYNSAIIGLEPERNGKEITITSSLEGQEYTSGDEINISWTASNVTSFNIDYSADNGYSWSEIAEGIPDTNNYYTWIPEGVVGEECMIKITDADDVNIYKNSGVFEIEGEPLLPSVAQSPSPVNDVEDVSLSPVLSWTNGDNTDEIKLYFGNTNPPGDMIAHGMLMSSVQMPANVLQPLTKYYWKVISLNEDGETEGEVWSFTTLDNSTGINDEKGLPSEFALEQNYPNPFNPETVIHYQLPEKADVKLKVYDILGHEIATLVNGEQTAGYKEVKFDASGFSSGIYICRLFTEKFTATKKMLLLK